MTAVKKESLSPPTFRDFPEERRIAYRLSEGKSPGIVFLGGFHSDMTGTKATALEAFSQKRGQRFLRFDYTGHGQSSGRFEDGTIGAWKRDALDIIDHAMPGKNILVGSSMGGWIMLLAALERKNTVAGLVGLASAPDFTERLIWDKFSEHHKKQLLEEGVVHLPSCHGDEPYPITRNLIEEGRNHLLLDGQIDLDVPIRLIHGSNDEEVPPEIPLMLADCMTSRDISLHMVPGGGHRLSEPGQLRLIEETVEELLASS